MLQWQYWQCICISWHCCDLPDSSSYISSCDINAGFVNCNKCPTSRMLQKVRRKKWRIFLVKRNYARQKRVTDPILLFETQAYFQNILKNTFSLLNFSSEVVFRRWIVIMISGWLVLMWIWRLFVKIDERGSFLDNVDLNQEPLVLDTLPLTKIFQDVS